MPDRISRLPLIGGHRALDLVNTVAPRIPVEAQDEYLATPEDLRVWAGRTGLVDASEAGAVGAAWAASPAAAARALVAVRATRDALSAVLSAHLARGAAAAATRDELEHLSLAWAAAASRSRLAPTTDGRVAARWAIDSSPALLIADRISQDAVDLLCDVDLDRLGMCPVEEGGCGWLFLDHSRNRSRRWCTMEACGTGSKARRLTERRRVARGAAARPGQVAGPA